MLLTDLAPTLDVSLDGDLTDLRFDPEEGQYIANFRPDRSGGGTAEAKLGEQVLGSTDFTVVEAGKANGKGNTK